MTETLHRHDSNDLVEALHRAHMEVSSDPDCQEPKTKDAIEDLVRSLTLHGFAQLFVADLVNASKGARILKTSPQRFSQLAGIGLVVPTIVVPGDEESKGWDVKLYNRDHLRLLSERHETQGGSWNSLLEDQS